MGGREVRFIERTDSRAFKTVEDCFFVDSGLTYDNSYDIAGVTLGTETVIEMSDADITASGLAVGDEVVFSDIEWEKEEVFGNDEQMYDVRDPIPDPNNAPYFGQLNRRTATVTDVTSPSVTVNIDSSDYPSEYVSGGLIRKKVSTIYGLWHLEGENVAVLADGRPVYGLTVSDGSITLPVGMESGRIQVGLRYAAEIETLDMATYGDSAVSLLSKRKSITEVRIISHDTSGIFAWAMMGEDSDGYETPRELTLERATSLVQPATWPTEWPAPLHTGTIRLDTPSPGWVFSGRLIIRQPQPLPMGILGIIPEFEIQDTT